MIIRRNLGGVETTTPKEGVLKLIAKLPWVILAITVMLGGVGVLALYSAAEGSWQPWAWRHFIRMCIGIILMALVAMVPIWTYRKISWLGWLGAVGILFVLEFIGTGSGVQRWVSVGGFNLQPSEPAKLAVVLVLAAYFHGMNPERILMLRSYLPALILALVPFVQVLMQPDLGTSVMLLGSAAAVIFVAGMPGWIIAGLIVVVALAMPVLWSQLYDYQRDRLMVFFNPGADQLGAGYQITQSKIALGSGGVMGKGYLQGSQSRLNYLPEKQTDFVFTMIGEEFGFLGCLFIIGLYITLIALILQTGLRLKYHFSRLMIAGIATMLFLFMFINIGMVTGILPVVGAPLPLISYGGTAMMTVFIALGLIISAIIHDQEGMD